MGWKAAEEQKKARVQSTPGRVMGTFPLSPEEGDLGDACGLKREISCLDRLS
jgi:hypothetical protein